MGSHANWIIDGPPELNSSLFVLRLKSRRTQTMQEGTLALRSPGGWGQLHQGAGSHGSPNSLPVPLGTLLRLHSSHSFPLSLLDLGSASFLRVGTTVIVAFPKPGKNMTYCWQEPPLLWPCFLASLSLKGEHGADPRWALFLLLTWAPLRGHLPQVPLVLAVSYCSTSGIFLSWKNQPSLASKIAVGRWQCAIGKGHRIWDRSV